jgi:putative redox protein
MVRAASEPVRYQILLSDGRHEVVADTAAEKGGADSGFRPHDLLEASLASCVSMTVRMYADRHGIPLRGVITTVTMDRTHPEEVVFRYDVALDGDLTPEQERKLLLAAHACPVRRTLSKPIRFEHGMSGPRS